MPYILLGDFLFVPVKYWNIFYSTVSVLLTHSIVHM